MVISAASEQFGKRVRAGAGGLYAHIVETLGQEIVDGRMPADQIVYAEQLTTRFGISRSVVRESVRTLSSMGLLESRPQVGTKVLPISSWDLLNPQIIKWRGAGPEAKDQQLELLELRLGIEPMAARFAAERMTPASSAELLKAAELMHEAMIAGDGYAFFDADSHFHRLLLEGSNNRLIGKFSETIDAGLHTRSTMPSTELNAAAVQLHIDLARAVAANNSAQAVQLATQILEQTLHEFDAE
jgi:DNA-binding FadR family transcriptional regulator